MKRLTALTVMLLTACSGEALQVSSGNAGAFEPDIAVGVDRIAIAWNDNRAGNDEIYLRLFDRDLQPLSEELRLTKSPDPSYEAAIASTGDNFAIAWYDRARDGRLTMMLGAWDNQGTQLWQRQIASATGNSRIPALQQVDGNIFVAWVEDPASPDSADAPSTLRSAWLDASGNFLHAPFTVANASKTTWNLNTEALSGGRVAMVFDAATTTRKSELYLALVSDNTSVVTRLSDDDGYDSKYPDIAVHGETAALTWFDMKDGNEEVYVASVNVPPPVHATVDGSSTRITNTPGESIGAYLVWNGEVLGLAWNDNDSGQHEIFFRTFDSNLQPLSDTRKLTDTTPDSMIPSIEALNDGFVLAWNEVVPGEGSHGDDMGTTHSEVMIQVIERR